MLAGLTKIPEVEIDAEEAKELAESIVAVNRHYNTMLDEKTLDWINLIMCCGSLYGSRMLAYRMRIANERKQSVKPAETPLAAMGVETVNGDLIDLYAHRAS